MLKRYREIKGLTEFAGLKPYHRQSKVSQGSFNDPKVVDELLTKKIDQLLAQKFSGDHFRLLTEATIEDLLSPFIDKVGERPIEVSMAAVGKKFSDSPFAMLKRYHRLIGREFPYSPACFMGSPETRARRILGEFSGYDRRLMRTQSGDFNAAIFGMRSFAAPEKAVVRDMLIDAAASMLGDSSIYYVGLEDQNLRSLRLIREYLNFAPDRSVVVERDKRVFNAMEATRRHLPNGEGRAISQVQFRLGNIEDEIPRLSGRYNLVNLDFVGHLSRATERALRGLADGKLQNKALIVVTLLNTALAKERSRQAGYSGGASAELLRIMQEAVQAKEPGAVVKLLGELQYQGGTGGALKTSMVAIFLEFEGNREVIEGE